MTNGAPSGALVMEGVEYHGIANENFFGILKDGTPIIGGAEEWNANEAIFRKLLARPSFL